ncbi:hypothetical protein [Ensifer sp. SSB1]|uniref:hypothetical protein n=1 Tax=Ensifer sp. SSB1 TaxID=2795385 RepID=UPI001A4E1F51|nr:hypothetical protein [Ensifer sp. SSB1]MBK5567074.1 hypothetical protein [Ensifer sp. SSB1]
MAGINAAKAGADIGFIGHTSLGAGLPTGDVRRYDFNACLRFVGKLMVTEVLATALEEILARCNQDGEIALPARTDDCRYASPTNRSRKFATSWFATTGREPIRKLFRQKRSYVHRSRRYQDQADLHGCLEPIADGMNGLGLASGSRPDVLHFELMIDDGLYD